MVFVVVDNVVGTLCCFGFCFFMSEVTFCRRDTFNSFLPLSFPFPL